MTSFQISKGSDCRRSQHGLIQIHEFERRIIVRINNKGGDVPCIKCRVCNIEARLRSERAIGRETNTRLFDRSQENVTEKLKRMPERK